MQYEDTVAWLYGRQALGVKLGLEKVETLLAKLGNLHHKPAIHIAGTNGKGSVARYVQRILTTAGYRVGLTTSPHLHDFCERIQIDTTQIAPQEVNHYVAQLQPIVKEMDAEGNPPTFFELVIAMAWLHFHDTDLVVLETGMGGRLDATNLCKPLVTAITNIGLDHQEFLGDHIGAIAMEKAGIMKPGIPLVTATTGDALLALKMESQRLQVPMSIIGEDYHAMNLGDAIHMTGPSGDVNIPLKDAGTQIENAAVAIAIIDALRIQGFNISQRDVSRGLQATEHAGRFEHMGKDPEWILDGAHNVNGAHALREHLADQHWGGFHLIVGVAKDKDWQEMLAQWVPLACHVHAVRVPNDRSLDPQEITQYAKAFGIPCTAYETPTDAMAHVRDRVVVAGSLFVVAAIRGALLGLEGPRGNQ